MLEIIAIRHGLTQWNQQKRIQGHTDIPLCAEGIELLKQYRLPQDWFNYSWYCSPLQRARQTAQQLGLNIQLETRLKEMHWGDWEGLTLQQLQQKYGDEFTQMESKGLDMHPHNGESPRLVKKRLTQWIKTLEQQKAESATIGIITHKGVIRALLAAACDWDMTHKPPVKLDYLAAQKFGWDQQRWHLLEANIPLLKE